MLLSLYWHRQTIKIGTNMATEEVKKPKVSLDNRSLITIIAIIVAVGSLTFAGLSHMYGENQGRESEGQSQNEQSDQETNDDGTSSDNQKDGETNDDTQASPSSSAVPTTQKK
jgi:cytoskeletal protein RodZ